MRLFPRETTEVTKATGHASRVKFDAECANERAARRLRLIIPVRSAGLLHARVGACVSALGALHANERAARRLRLIIPVRSAGLLHERVGACVSALGALQHATRTIRPAGQCRLLRFVQFIDGRLQSHRRGIPDPNCGRCVDRQRLCQIAVTGHSPAGSPHLERRIEAYYLQRTRFEGIAERKLRRRQFDRRWKCRDQQAGLARGLRRRIIKRGAWR